MSKLLELEELKATAAKLQQQIEALEKSKQWEPNFNEPYYSRWWFSRLQ